MKIAVTSQNKKSITDHAGRCRNFWVFSVDDQKISDRTLIELPKEQSFHDCPRHEEHVLDVVDVLISGGMGQGLVNRLSRRGISGVITQEQDPEQAVLKYMNGSLALQEAGACKHKGCP